MRPKITIKTSHPLQKHILQTGDSEKDMEQLREHRDKLIDTTVDNIEFLDQLEDRLGLEFKEFKLDVWVYTGRDASISSPLLIANRGNVDVEFVELAYLVAKELIYQNLPDLKPHKMLEAGDDRMDVTAGMLAYEAVSSVAGEDYIDDILQKPPFSEHSDTWDTVHSKVKKWSDDETLLEFLGIEKKPKQEPQGEL